MCHRLTLVVMNFKFQIVLEMSVLRNCSTYIAHWLELKHFKDMRKLIIMGFILTEFIWIILKLIHWSLFILVCVCSVMSSCLRPSGSSVHEIFPARILEWVALSSWPRDWAPNSCISCIGWWILYHWATRKSFILAFISNN